MTESGPDNKQTEALQRDLNRQVLLDDALFEPLSKALKLSGIDFDTLVEPLLITLAKGDPPALTLAGYFKLLERISDKIGDEALNLTSRPLLPGALQFALSQALTANSLEEAMRRIANSFNLLHGGEYNHVYIRDHCLVYEINIDGFPYPIEVKRPQQDSLLECILVLMHFMFVYLTSEALDDLLVRVRTRRKLVGRPDISSQLGYWKVHVSGRAPSFSLHYDYSAAVLPITLNSENLPNPRAIYSLVAEFVKGSAERSEQQIAYAEQVVEMLRLEMLGEDLVAQKLGMSTRSLRRHLVREGTSFRALSDNARNDRAKKMIHSGIPFDAIAEKLGYADERSFRRAFLRWNEVTPSAFRELNT
jgi:AraC-like DNA-binding protein